jgi:hypothetical protein
MTHHDTITLRRAQRAAARTKIDELIHLLGIYRSHAYPLPRIDQLINTFGPDYTLTLAELLHALKYADPVAEIRFLKRTPETAPTSPDPSADAQLHGGDGNSGETPNPAQTPRAAAAQDPTDANAPGDLAEDQEWARVRTDGDATQPRPERAEASEREANPPAVEAPAPTDNPPLGAAAAGDGATGHAAAEERHPTGAEGSLHRAIFPYATNYGGFFADNPIDISHPEARRIHRQLLKLIRRHDPTTTSQTPGHRPDPHRLIREATTRRWHIARARQPRPAGHILLICDCSGSCSAVCDATLGACLRIAHLHHDVTTLVTSNSWVAGTNATITTWLAHHRLRPSLTVIFGDWDAGAEYQALAAAGADLIWFDSYAAKHGVRPASRHLRAPAARWPRQPLAWYQGVNSAAATITALNHLLRA